jgi:hypothetical protein
MPRVLSSTFVVGHKQRDGRCYVQEIHKLEAGEVREREYGPIDVEANDLRKIARGFAAQIEAEEQQGES